MITHSDEISEPHVRELVGDHGDEKGSFGLGDFVLEDVVVVDGDCAGMLHGSAVELGTEDVVVLAEGVGVVEEGLVELHAFARGLEVQNLLVGQVRVATLPAVKCHRDVFVGRFSLDLHVGSRAHVEQVARNHFRLPELPK